MFNKIYEKIKEFIVNNYKFLLTVIFIFIFCFWEVPYVIYTPGGIVPLESRIKIKDGYKSNGSLNMSYVSMLKGRIPLVLASFAMKNWDLVPDKDITLEDQDIDDMIKMDKLYMDSSIDYATYVAYNFANKDIKIDKYINNVIYITKEAKTDIKKYDIVLEVDGIKVSDITEVQDILQNKKENDEVDVLVLRKDKKIHTKSKLYKTSDGLKIGIVFLTTLDYTTNPPLEVKSKSRESGSSGGLMLSLAIYNSLIKEDITHGLKVVGTGTIDMDGNVGEIDGVKYKLLGAKKNKADVFICPVNNYKEAIKVNKKYKLNLKIKGVNTFKEALEYLDSIK